MVLAAASLSLYIYTCPVWSLFPAEHILSKGNTHLSDEEFAALVGIHEHESLLKISEKQVSHNLLESPWIRSVNVRKEFPGTLAVEILY